MAEINVLILMNIDIALLDVWNSNVCYQNLTNCNHLDASSVKGSMSLISTANEYAIPDSYVNVHM